MSDSPLCIAMNLALDNRRRLPPFMPVQRREDGIFMAVLRRCLPFVWTGHLPYAVDHEPPARNARELLNFDSIGRDFFLNDHLEWLLMSEAGVAGDDPERDLVATGRMLTEVAALSPRTFEGYLRTAGVRALSAQIAGLERRLEERSGRPEYWARDAHRYAAALRFALTLPDLVVPRDIAASESERLAVQQDLVGRFGLLLTHWPAIWAAATEQEECTRMSP